MYGWGMNEPYPTPAEDQRWLERNWEGERCSHGHPVGMMVGYDNPCGACEYEMEYEYDMVKDGNPEGPNAEERFAAPVPAGTVDPHENEPF